MLRFLATRAYNRFDALWISLMAISMHEGEYVAGIVAAFLGAYVSGIVEAAAETQDK